MGGKSKTTFGARQVGLFTVFEKLCGSKYLVKFELQLQDK